MITHTDNLSPETLKSFMTWEDPQGVFRGSIQKFKEHFNLDETEQEQTRKGFWPKQPIVEVHGEPAAKKRFKGRSSYEGTLNLDRYQSYDQEPYDVRKKRKIYKPCKIGIQCNLSWRESNERLAKICTTLANGINELNENGFSVSINALYHSQDIFKKDKNTFYLMTLVLKTEETDYNALEILAHRSFPRLSNFTMLRSLFKKTGRTDYLQGLGTSIKGLPKTLEASYDILIDNLTTPEGVKKAIDDLLSQ